MVLLCLKVIAESLNLKKRVLKGYRPHNLRSILKGLESQEKSVES